MYQSRTSVDKNQYHYSIIFDAKQQSSHKGRFTLVIDSGPPERAQAKDTVELV